MRNTPFLRTGEDHHPLCSQQSNRTTPPTKRLLNMLDKPALWVVLKVVQTPHKLEPRQQPEERTEAVIALPPGLDLHGWS
jgi:hypothetical protein